MKIYIPIMTLLFSAPGIAQTIAYPETAKSDVADTYFGQSVPDPYRWLEDDRAAATADWVKRQNEVTYGYLSQIPYREAIRTRLEKLWNYEKRSAPFTEGDLTYYFRNDGLQNQSVLYRKNRQGREEVFLDPNTFSKDGTTSLEEIKFTKDGSLAAYTISEGGSDWRKVIVISARDRKPVGETLVDVKFSGISWKGTDGFYYSSYDKPDGSALSAKTDQHKLYYHKLGAPQSSDRLVFGKDLKRRYVGGTVTEDGRYLVITAANSTSGNEVYIQELSDPESKIITVITGFEHDVDFVDHDKGRFYFLTNLGAPNKRLVAVDLKNPGAGNWKTIIPAQSEVLAATVGGGFIFAQYLKDAISLVSQYDYDGKRIRDIQLPGIGTAAGFTGKREDTTLYFTFTNYTTPSSIFAYEPSAGTVRNFWSPKLDFDAGRYTSEQVFYPSPDGTRIPMIITYRKGLERNGTNPTMLYGYGGFNVSLTPAFSVAVASWIEMGGVYVVANLRGGGEYGRQWHDKGTKFQKQNVFDDFIAAAQYLIDRGYTSKDRLAIRGGSNGGLLVGAAMTQRPDLFRVALPAVGVLDMLRYHKFTAGAGWAYDYGTADDSKEMFDYLKKYSPAHNVRPGISYPATLITTGDHDDRVVPAHSYKFAAELQAKQAGGAPVLIRIETNAGHGAGKPVSKTIAETADVLAFTFYNMGYSRLPE